MVRSNAATDRYRQYAVRFRQRAATVGDNLLRDSYLGLAEEYERLAQLFNPPDHEPIREAEPPSRFAKSVQLGKHLIRIVRDLLGDGRGVFGTCRSPMSRLKPAFRS